MLRGWEVEWWLAPRVAFFPQRPMTNVHSTTLPFTIHLLLFLSGKANIAVARILTEEINILEKAALKIARYKPQFNRRLSVPGIGEVIALTISLELGSLLRFRKVGNYLSYCRLVIFCNRYDVLKETKK